MEFKHYILRPNFKPFVPLILFIEIGGGLR